MTTQKQYLNFFSHKSRIYIKYIDKGGLVRYESSKDWTPEAFIPATSDSRIDGHSIYGHPLTRLTKNETVYEAKRLIQEIETDNFKVHGFSKVDYAYTYEKFKGQKVDTSKVVIHLFDIETTVDHTKIDPIAALEEINMITVHCSKRKQFFCFYVNEKSHTLPEFENLTLIHCQNEEELLLRYLDWHSSNYPDILSGWNSEGFDLPYIHNRILKLLGPDYVKKLSPFGIVRLKEGTNMFGAYQNIDIKGISCLDYRELYKKFIKDPRESYSLDYISKVEIKEEKLKHESGIPGHLLYKTHFEDALRYNIQDVGLLVRLEEKRQIIELAITMAYLCFCNFSDVLSNMRLIDMQFYMWLRDRNLYFTWNYNAPPRQQFEGAAVKPVIPGRYRWAATFDVTSEYPSLVMALNIGLETLVKKKVLPVNVHQILSKKADRKYALENGLSLAANGSMYRRDRESFMSAVLRDLFQIRQEYKRLKVEADKETQKAKAILHKRQALKDKLQSDI